MHVLAIEDLKIERFILKKILHPHFEVTTLSSAREAVAFALCNSFDIALINVMLEKDVDCIELLHDLQFTSRSRDFVAFAITSHTDQRRNERLLKAGFKAVIKKPLDLEVFNHLLKREEYKFKVKAQDIYLNYN